MILKVGNQTFNSEDVPVAVILSYEELDWIRKATPKPSDEPRVFSKVPKDIPPDVAMAWLIEATPEIRVNLITLARVAGNPRKE